MYVINKKNILRNVNALYFLLVDTVERTYIDTMQINRFKVDPVDPTYSCENNDSESDSVVKELQVIFMTLSTA